MGSACSTLNNYSVIEDVGFNKNLVQTTILDCTPFYYVLNNDDLLEFSKLFDILDYDENVTIVNLESELEGFFVIDDGEIELAFNDLNSTIRKKGDIFGEAWMDTLGFNIDIKESPRNSKVNDELAVPSQKVSPNQSPNPGYRELSILSNSKISVASTASTLFSSASYTLPKYSASTLTKSRLLYCTFEKLTAFYQCLTDASKEALFRTISREYFHSIKKLPFLSHMSNQKIVNFVPYFRFLVLKDSTDLFRYGEQADDLYIVVHGAISLHNQDVELKKCGPGSFFGETSVIMNLPRTCDATNSTPTLLLALSHKSIILFEQESANVAKQIKRFVRQSLCSYLRSFNLPFLKSISEDLYHEFVELCELRDCVKGEVLFKEGDTDNTNMFMVIHGNIELTSIKDKNSESERVVCLAKFGPGKYFGELCLLSSKNDARVGTAVCLERSIVMSVTKESMKKFYELSPATAVSFMTVLAKYDVTLTDLLEDKVGVMHFMNHLKTEFSTENLEYLELIKVYRRSFEEPNSESKSKEIADNIMKTYVYSNAPKQVNLKSLVQGDLIKNYQNLQFTPSLFTDSYNEIFHLLKLDSFNRFKAGNNFQNYLLDNDTTAQQAVVRAYTKNTEALVA